MPSRGVSAPTAAHKTIVSPYRITHDPSACLATRPISTVRSRSPSLIDSFKYFLTVISISSPFDDSGVSTGVRRLVRRDFSNTNLSLRYKEEKAAEPGREALAAFLHIGRARCLDTSCRRHVRLGSKLFENACLS